MIHPQHGIIGFACFSMKQRVCRERAKSINAVILECGNGRRDDTAILIAKLAVFTSMRVQAADRNSGIIDPEEVTQGLGKKAAFGKDVGAVQHPRHIAKGDMDRQRHHAQCVTGEHHDGPSVTFRCQAAQKFGMAGMFKASFNQHGFVDRAGHNRAGASLLCERGGGADGINNRRCVSGVCHAGPWVCRPGYRQDA